MMQELSMNILDVAENSVRAGACLIGITVDEQPEADRLTVTITDDGCGMTPEQLQSVTDPFYTTRTTRRVGLGVPFFKQAAELTGGRFDMTSTVGKGTTVRAEFIRSSVDRMPLGEINETVAALIHANPGIDFLYIRRLGKTRWRWTRANSAVFWAGSHSPTRRSPDSSALSSRRTRRSCWQGRVTDFYELGGTAYMKSIAELEALRNEMKTKIGVRKDGETRIRVVVGMATCGIAAGARPVLTAFVKEIETRKLADVAVTQPGCIGICQFEPVVEVYDESGSKTTYVHVTPEKVQKIVAQHIVNGSPVAEYAIGASAQ